MKRKIKPELGEFNTACEMLYQLTDLLLAVGIVEVSISKKTRSIEWDTEGGGLIDPDNLDIVSSVITATWMDMIDRKVRE